jgi:transcriptional regulator with XRE-family HTH domain
LTDDGPENVSSRRARRLRQLARAFSDRNFRHAFIGRQLRLFLAEQIRALRGNRSQKEFGDAISKPQSVVSRLEKQADKNVSIQTLIDIAERLDIAVVIRFVDFPTFLRYTADYSENAVAPPSYDQNAIDKFIDALTMFVSAPIISQAIEPSEPARESLSPPLPTDAIVGQQTIPEQQPEQLRQADIIPFSRPLNQPTPNRRFEDVRQSREFVS